MLQIDLAGLYFKNLLGIKSNLSFITFSPFFERVYSHPLYQLQPFVQVPPLDHANDVCLEEGETVYENKYVYEWVLFWRLLILMLPIPFVLMLMETYNTQSTMTPEYQSKFSLWVPLNNMLNRGYDRPMAKKILYWGSDMWLWQHWVRKGLVYPFLITTVFTLLVSCFFL